MGPRFFTFMHVLGLMMVSLSSKYYQKMLAQSVCARIGTPFIFISAMSATFLRAKRGIASGLTTASSSLGGVIFPLTVQHPLPKVSFGRAMRTCAFLILVLMVFATFTMGSNVQHKPRQFDVVDYLHPFREVKSAVLTTGYFFMYFAMYIPLNEVVIAAQHYGTPAWLAWSLVPIPNGASLVTRTAPNLLSDKLGHFTVATIMTLCSAVLCIALWLPGRGSGSSVAFAVLFGISSGSVIGLGLVLFATMSPTQRDRDEDRNSGRIRRGWHIDFATDWKRYSCERRRHV